ncbi:DUF485 domain-containing protein [Fictibacillus sp. KU28468]|uniref:DUF485 domain-containing protein n=1 Tax=Fictibacillus sp. KU28468 TaxID=2991053 RepID=UPI00223E3AF3|nr:DUF485 domain-containing protein [Fictibacillus sp. KU28468]UZJ79363.1 DUF485 domain-containing protein [Fictibacillus sp. KU28468]
MLELNEQTVAPGESLNYEEIAASEKFKRLLRSKKRFTISVTLFFLCFALLLPVLAFYTDLLIKPAVGAISWGWVFAFAQFAMTWIICHLYVKKAAEFDDMAAQVLNQEVKGR